MNDTDQHSTDHPETITNTTSTDTYATAKNTTRTTKQQTDSTTRTKIQKPSTPMHHDPLVIFAAARSARLLIVVASC